MHCLCGLVLWSYVTLFCIMLVFCCTFVYRCLHLVSWFYILELNGKNVNWIWYLDALFHLHWQSSMLIFAWTSTKSNKVISSFACKSACGITICITICCWTRSFEHYRVICWLACIRTSISAGATIFRLIECQACTFTTYNMVSPFYLHVMLLHCPEPLEGIIETGRLHPSTRQTS